MFQNSNLQTTFRNYFEVIRNRQKFLSYTGLLIALYIALYFCNVIISPTIQLRLGFLAIAAAGMVGGPFMGIAVGAIGDIISMIITGGMGASFFFGFTLSYSIMGLVFGLLFYKTRITWVKACFGGLTEFLISILLNTYWLSFMYGTPYQAQFILRIPKCLIMLPITSILLYTALKSICTALKKARLLYQ